MKIQTTKKLSNAGLHRSGGLGSPASRWSLRNNATGEYVNLYTITGSNDAIRADRHLDIEIDLPDGVYTLAAGRDSDRIEKTITVGAAAGDEIEAMKDALRSLPRLEGASSKQTDYADKVRRAWAKEVAASKLSPERKAEEYAALGTLTSARAILDNKDRWPSDALYDQEAEK